MLPSPTNSWSKQDCGNVKAEADCSVGIALVGDRTPAMNQLNSGVRNHDVTASSDKDAEIISDRRSNGRRQWTSPTNTITMKSTTEQCGTRPCGDIVLRQSRRTADITIRSNRRSDTAARPTSTSGSSDQESLQSSPDTARVDTDTLVHRATESVTTSDDAAASPVHGRQCWPRCDMQSLLAQPGATGTGSPASARETVTPENKVDQACIYIVQPSVTAATKPKNFNATITPLYATTVPAKTEVTKNQPNVLNSTCAENESKGERNLGSSTAATYGSEATKGGAVSAGNSAANSDGLRTTARKSKSDLQHRLMTSSDAHTCTDTKPATTHIIATLPSGSQVLSSPTEKEMSADTDNNIQTTGDDDVNSREVAEAVISTAATDSAPAAGKYTNVPAERESENNSQSSKAPNSSTAEQAGRIPKISRLPRRLNQNASSCLNDSDSSGTAGVQAGSATNSTGDVAPRSLAVKLVRVDRMLRSAPTAAPSSIRSTGVATPAVQAQKLANAKDMKDATVSGRLSTPVQTKPRSTPSTEKQQADNTVEQSKPRPPTTTS